MKKILCFFVTVCFTALLVAQDSDAGFNDFDSLFAEATDVEVQQQEPPVAQESQPQNNTVTEKTSSNPYYKPLSFSGRLEAEVGGVVFFENKNFNFSGYLNLLNDLSFSARASKNLAVKGTLRAKLPSFSLSLHELYFDYLFLDKLYISAGKKNISWGYVQLFSESSNYGTGVDAFGKPYSGPLLTNVVADSGESVSAVLQLPVLTGTITAVAMYSGEVDTTPSYKDFSFAGSIEMTLLQTSINLFARTYPSLEGNLPHLYKPPVLGLEMKRTFFGTDFYAQSLVSVFDFKKLDSKEGYDCVAATGGFYRLWEAERKVGFNVEYQYVYTPNGEDSHAHRVAFAGGISRLGSRKNIKLGIDWNHDFTKKSGDAKLGLILSGIFPHADWINGFSVAYASEQKIPDMTFATSLRLLLDY
ncbi:MAG: hypothetical protein J6B81_00530 [Spirochaetaceae bacterium]|nr:hypothetical protein [Spirochaetaceae bacterium]